MLGYPQPSVLTGKIQQIATDQWLENKTKKQGQQILS